jgi:hypothetical protein
MTTNGINQTTWCHRLGWQWKSNCIKECGYYYMRPIIHFNPVLREKALMAGFKDIRFGEDKDYSERLNLYLTKEYFLEKPLFQNIVRVKYPKLNWSVVYPKKSKLFSFSSHS